MGRWFNIYKNILHLHFSEGFYRLPESAKNAVSPHRIGERLLKVAGYTVVRLIGNLFEQVEAPEELQGRVWLYVVSQNNVDSLRFVQEQMPEAVFVAGQNKEIGKYNRQVARLSLRRKLLYYYRLLPLSLRLLQENPKRFRRFFDVLYDAIGFYEVYRRKLQRYKPKAIVFANDHNPDARAMLLAAKALGIKTAYVQHASVSSFFPPLQFDLNLLEGQDSLNKYKVCGPISGRVALVGMPKADAYVPFRNQSSSIKTIGIGANLMDLVDEVAQLVQYLAANLPQAQVIIRPHPRDRRDFTFLQKQLPEVYISAAAQEPTFEYLQKLDVQISGNSGIHLEATLLNVWSIYYNFNPQERLHDYYGFLRNGLIEKAESKEALVQLVEQHLQQKPEVYRRAQYFNATVGTVYDGRSGELALQQLRQFIEQPPVGVAEP